MYASRRHAVALTVLTLLFAPEASAVQIMTDPTPELGDTDREFQSIAITPDGSTLVATTNIDVNGQPATDARTMAVPIPSNPITEVATVTQLTTTDFFAGAYDVDFPPVVSPDGQTVLVTHDGYNGVNTLFTVPIAGEGASAFSGLFGSDPNLVSPGTNNRGARYSPNGSTIFFINGNSGFEGGPLPDFDAGDDPPRSFFDGPEWDQLWAVPAGGGTPIAVTTPANGDIDNNLFAVTPDNAAVVYAPSLPVTKATDRGQNLGKLFTVPATGGTSTEIPITPSTNPLFQITNRVEVASDGQSVLFIGDYETPGKNELYSVPIAGGAPVRISDDLPFAGDVTSFEISPDGLSVAYAAGQTASGNNELFLKTIGGAAGSSIRISDAPTVNDGTHDVDQTAKGAFVFAPDGSKVYAVGDLVTGALNDLFEFDLTEKTGLTPSVYTYVGPSGGDFFNESNWEDAESNTAPAGTINPDTAIFHSLLIDGDTVVTGEPGQVDFGLGGSLELTAGSSLTLGQTGQQLDFNPGSGLKITDATITVDDDVILEGSHYLYGGTIESVLDDVEFQDGHETVIDGTTILSGDNTFFDNSAASITNATFEPADRFGLSFTSDVTVTDTIINVQGGAGDIDEVFDDENGLGSTLTLKGASQLFANQIDDGLSLVVDDSSVATLNTANGAVDAGNGGTITVMSSDAELVLTGDAANDVRSFIINGLTGLSYSDDPSAWNVTDWDGFTALSSLKLVATFVGLAGDYNDDGVVDAADYTVWRDSNGQSVALPNDTTPGEVGPEDYTVWADNYGAVASSAGLVPEPAAVGSALCGLLLASCRRRRR